MVNSSLDLALLRFLVGQPVLATCIAGKCFPLDFNEAHGKFYQLASNLICKTYLQKIGNKLFKKLTLLCLDEYKL